MKVQHVVNVFFTDYMLPLCLQGSGKTSKKAGTAVFPGLSRADTYRPACSESSVCYAGVHTIRVCIL